MAKAVKKKKWSGRDERYYSKANDVVIDPPVPSVTTVLGILEKPALVPWASGCCANYVTDHLAELRTASDDVATLIIKEARNAHRTAGRTAMDVGTIVHEAIETYLAGGEPMAALGDNSQALMSFQAFLDLEKTHTLTPRCIELVVYHSRLGYAGRVDFIGMVNGKLTLLDWKSSKGIYDEYWFQVAAYGQAFMSENPERIEQYGVLRLDKETGAPELVLKTWEEAEVGFDVFVGALHAFSARKRWEALCNE